MTVREGPGCSGAKLRSAPPRGAGAGAGAGAVARGVARGGGAKDGEPSGRAPREDEVWEEMEGRRGCCAV